jgi:hypothetical protein
MMDAATMILNRDDRWNAIRWRTNRCFMTQLCDIIDCPRYAQRQHPLTRECLNLLPDATTTGLYFQCIKGTINERYNKARKWIRRFHLECELAPNIPDRFRHKYSILDKLLNDREHHIFAYFWHILTRRRAQAAA